jgi:uncharacterized protein
MTTVKQQIQADFIQAMKSKDEDGKRAISLLKAKITEGEKANKNTELTDTEIIKVVSSAIKQRRQSLEEYQKFGRMDLAKVEEVEIQILERYLPKQMDSSEIETAVREIIQSLSEVVTNPNALIGRTIGEFNKKYVGRADIGEVRMVIEKIVGK